MILNHSVLRPPSICPPFSSCFLFRIRIYSCQSFCFVLHVSEPLSTSLTLHLYEWPMNRLCYSFNACFPVNTLQMFPLLFTYNLPSYQVTLLLQCLNAVYPNFSFIVFSSISVLYELTQCREQRTLGGLRRSEDPSPSLDFTLTISMPLGNLEPLYSLLQSADI